MLTRPTPPPMRVKSDYPSPEEWARFRRFFAYVAVVAVSVLLGMCSAGISPC